MSYKIGTMPSYGASTAEIADYLEVNCLLSNTGSFSVVEAAEDNGFVEDEEDRGSLDTDVYNDYTDALGQIDERSHVTSGRYPFTGEKFSVVLNQNCSEYNKTIYTFLLFATRWSMGANRIINEKDGTLLFERLCNEVLTKYFGQFSKGMVFGTGNEADEKGFEAKVKQMLGMFHEKGYQFRNPEGDRHHQKDAKVDLVSFIPFADARKGHFIAFGQCKTGTSWRGTLGQLNPINFCKLYIQPPLTFTPICVYMVSEACELDWEELAVVTTGILFDRTRIMQFLPDSIDEKLYNDIAIWVKGVKERIL